LTVRIWSELPSLDPLKQRFLELVARIGQEHERLSARDMTAKNEYGSSATVYACLGSMRKKEWIMLSDTSTMRKQIELRHAASLHFDKHSAYLT